MGRPGCLLGRLPPLSITGVFSARLRPPAVPSWAVWSCPPPCVGGRRGCAAPARYFSPGALFPFFVAVPVFSRRSLPVGGGAGGGVACRAVGSRGGRRVCPWSADAAPGLPRRPPRALSTARPAPYPPPAPPPPPPRPEPGAAGWVFRSFVAVPVICAVPTPSGIPYAPSPFVPLPRRGRGK